MLNPDFWNDSKQAEVTMKKLKGHKNWLSKYEQVEAEVEDLEVLFEFFKEGEGTEEDVDARYEKVLGVIEDVEFRSTLNRPEDELNAILEVNAGAGGTEACDWAYMLYRMYVMWGEKNGYKI